jgi:hypothetical protein
MGLAGDREIMQAAKSHKHRIFIDYFLFPCYHLCILVERHIPLCSLAKIELELLPS